MLSLIKEKMDFGFVKFQRHMEFIDQLLQAQLEADRVRERVVVYWRGYRCYVENNMPRLTEENLQIRLLNALKKVRDLSPEEEKVSDAVSNYIICIFLCSYNTLLSH